MIELGFSSRPAYNVKLTGSTPASPAGLAIIDITFRLEHGCGGVEIDSISFRNSFTAVLSVLVKQKVEGPWTLCLEKFVLMSNPHELDGAEKRHTISAEQFLAPMRNVQELRFVLQQPSTTWKDFTITELKFFGRLIALDGTARGGHNEAKAHTELFSSNKIADSLQKDDATDVQVDAEIQNISSCMQQVVTLMHYFKTHATNVDKATKFDVDGDYALSMLSYI